MGRVLDERGRFFGKVNVVDILVIVVIAALVVFAVRTIGCSPSTTPVKITLSAQSLRDDVATAVLQKWKVGTQIVNDGGAPVIGTVKSASSSKTLEEYTTQDGQLKLFQSPLYSDVTIVVLGQGTVKGNSVSVDGKTIREGDSLTVVGNNSIRMVVVTAVVWGADAAK